MKLTVKDIALTAVMSAVLCVLSPISIPIGPVPVSLTTFAIFLSLFVLGAKRGTISVAIYILIGLAGLPVFSGFQGGIAKLAGPTGGYILAFIPMAIIAGIIIDKNRNRPAVCLTGAVASSWITYILGSLWLSYCTNISLSAAFAAGVLPFILIDIAKTTLAFALGSRIYTALQRVSLTQ